MERSADFLANFADYSESVHGLSLALDSYATPGNTYAEVGGALQKASELYFDRAANLIRSFSDVERDADSTRALLAMIGVDILVMRQSALLAWFLDETDEQDGRGDVTPELQPAELTDLQPGLDEATLVLLVQVEGSTPPAVAGASNSPQPAGNRTVAKPVRDILDTAGDDMEGFLKVGVSAVLGAIVTAASQLWAESPQFADQLFGSRRLRWLAGKAVEEAQAKLGALWQVGGEAIPQLITEFGDDVRKALFKAGLTEGLASLLKEKEIVLDCDMKLADPVVTAVDADEAMLAAQQVVEDHKNWRWWFPWATRGGRVLSLIPLPGKRPWIVLATFTMMGLSVWLAAAYVGSPRLPSKLKLGIQSVPDIVDQKLGLPNAAARAKSAALEQTLQKALQEVLDKERNDAQVWAKAGKFDPMAAEEMVNRRLGASKDEFRGKLCALAGVPATAPAEELAFQLCKQLEMNTDEPIDVIVSVASGRLI